MPRCPLCGRYRGKSGLCADIVKLSRMTRTGLRDVLGSIAITFIKCHATATLRDDIARFQIRSICNDDRINEQELGAIRGEAEAEWLRTVAGCKSEAGSDGQRCGRPERHRRNPTVPLPDASQSRPDPAQGRPN